MESINRAWLYTCGNMSVADRHPQVTVELVASLRLLDELFVCMTLTSSCQTRPYYPANLTTNLQRPLTISKAYIKCLYRKVWSHVKSLSISPCLLVRNISWRRRCRRGSALGSCTAGRRRPSPGSRGSGCGSRWATRMERERNTLAGIARTNLRCRFGQLGPGSSCTGFLSCLAGRGSCRSRSL